MNKIVLSGIKRCGKDTCGKYLVDNYGFHRLALGDIVKEMCSFLFPNMKLDYSDDEKETKVIYKHKYTGEEWTPRDIWVYINVLKKVNPMIFLDRFVVKYQHMLSNPACKIVITDLRFTAVKGCYYATPEMEYLKCSGFKLCYIESSDTINEKNSNLAEEFYDTIEKNADYKFVNHKDGNRRWHNFLIKNKIVDGELK